MDRVPIKILVSKEEALRRIRNEIYETKLEIKNRKRHIKNLKKMLRQPMEEVCQRLQVQQK